MAGFEFEFECESGSNAYARNVMRFVQSKASDWDCSLRYHSEKPGVFEAMIDGGLISMQALAIALVSDLKAFAAAPCSDLSGPSRARVCLSILHSFFDGLDDLETGIAETADFFSASPNSYRFDVGNATHLRGIARDLRFALLSFENGRYPPTQLVEQIHTAVGALLRTALAKSSSRDSFPSLVAQAKEEGLISDDNANVLFELNSLRRNAKHRSQGVSVTELRELLLPAVGICHSLARRVREKTL
jgi:hypothetical protein